MFADDKSIENFQQLFFEFKKYLELQKEYTKLELTEKLTILLSYYPRHGGPVLSVICSGLCTGAFSRRTHGKFRHYSRYQCPDYGFSHYFPQAAYHLSHGKLPRQLIFKRFKII